MPKGGLDRVVEALSKRLNDLPEFVGTQSQSPRKGNWDREIDYFGRVEFEKGPSFSYQIGVRLAEYAWNGKVKDIFRDHNIATLDITLVFKLPQRVSHATAEMLLPSYESVERFAKKRHHSLNRTLALGDENRRYKVDTQWRFQLKIGRTYAKDISGFAREFVEYAMGYFALQANAVLTCRSAK